MSSESSSDSTSIPPNLLKNFNVYEVLEPQKNGAKNSEGTTVDKLIDIDDSSRDSGFQETELNASFFDKNRDFTLVDLYQNMFVTPQHIKQNVAHDDVTKLYSNVPDVDFKQFLDLLESDEKIDWTQISNLKKDGLSQRNSVKLLEKPRVLVPKVFTEKVTDPEDLIDEVLAQKNIEKQILQEINNAQDAPDYSRNVTKSTDYTPSSLNNSFSKESKFKCTYDENIPSTSGIYCPLDNPINNCTFIVRAMQKDEKVYKNRRLVRPNNQIITFTKGPNFAEKHVVLPQIMSRINARQTYLDEINSQKRRFILDAGEKVTKTEAESVINGKIRPYAFSSDFGMNFVSPDRSQTFKDPKLCMNKVTESIAVHTPTKTCMNCNKRGTDNNANLGTHSTLKDAKLYMQETTPFATNTAKTSTHLNDPCSKGTSSLHGIPLNTVKGAGNGNIPMNNKASSSLGAIPTRTEKVIGNIPSVKPNSSLSGASSKNDKDFGKLSPTVLMADCNKERLKAWKQSQMFKNFVMHGKFEL